jgi:hypothetical protein
MISKSWPYELINDIHLFIKGDPNEKTTFSEKVLNDLDVRPGRHVVSFSPNDERPFVSLDVPGLRQRRQQPLVFQIPAAEKGFRIIYGVLDFVNNVHGALLIDSNGKVVHTWQITERHLEWETSSEMNKFPHGFDVRPDGSIIVVFTRSSSIQRFGPCGDPVWAVKGNFHHSIGAEEENFIWALKKEDEHKFDFENRIVKLDAHNGRVIRSFTVGQIIKANPDISIFNVDGVFQAEWQLSDAFHANDVEPLPAELADAYPDFSAGDLLVSFRNLNLVFVIEQESLKVKWWRIGSWRSQHDPDWQPNGEITVYNNNSPLGPFSNIVSIDPSTYETEILVDGVEFNFFSASRGKHQVLPGGNVLITSTNQGRVLEVNSDNQVVFEFRNLFDLDKNEYLAVSEAMFLPQDYFEANAFSKCTEVEAP